MQANGNDYSCVAYIGGKFNKSVCGMAAKYKLPNAGIPTHCFKHKKGLINAIKDTEVPTCVNLTCGVACPKYGIRGNLPTICGKCCKGIISNGYDEIVDVTKQCRMLHCKKLATHGVTGMDLLPWLCPDHAEKVDFACSVIYKSKCLHCDNHATYITMGTSTYKSDVSDFPLAMCSEHVYILASSFGTKFELVNKCQALYCDENVFVELSYNKTLNTDVQLHSLCINHKHIQDIKTGLCETKKCEREAVGNLCGRNLCKIHLELQTMNEQGTSVDPVSVSSRDLLLAQVGRLPREMNIIEQRSFIDKLMTATGNSSKSAGMVASRKRKASQIEPDSVPSTPMSVTNVSVSASASASPSPIRSPTIYRSDPVTPASVDESRVSLPQTPCSPYSDSTTGKAGASSPIHPSEVEFPEIMSLDDINVKSAGTTGLTYEEAISYSENPLSQLPDYENLSDIIELCEKLDQNNHSQPVTIPEPPVYQTIYPAPILSVDEIIKQVINEYKFDFVYYSSSKCYYIKSPTPMFILADNNIKHIERPESCILVRVRSTQITYDIINSLFQSVAQAFTTLIVPKFCEYDI
jgi:hypothetical protein